MSTVCVLTPIVIGSWPAISAAVLGAAGAMGFTLAGVEIEPLRARDESTVETEIPNSEVVAESLARGEKIQIERDGVQIQLGVDDRGKCSVCVHGKGRNKGELRRIGEEVAGRIVQQF